MRQVLRSRPPDGDLRAADLAGRSKSPATEALAAALPRREIPRRSLTGPTEVRSVPKLVLLVHTDGDIRDEVAAAVRQAGYDVIMYAGNPTGDRCS
jgi:hypothetical protein